VPSASLSELLIAILAGVPLHSAALTLRAPFVLPTFYGLVASLGYQHARLRVLLSGVCPPPACAHPDDLRQTIAHLRAGFAADADLVAAFQLRFQVPLLL
jgi:hypothetical protein